LSYYYKGEIKFIVHVNYCNVRRLFERRGIFRVLDDLCGIDTVIEENTMVVLHSVPVEDKIENLEYWLGKHWYDNSPLFDTNLHFLCKNQPSPTGGKSYGHTYSHPYYLRPAVHAKKCFGIIRYLRILDRLDAKMTKALMQGFVEKWAYWEPCRPRYGSSLVRSTHPGSNPAFEKHDDLIKAFIRAVAGVVDPGMIQHKSGWTMAVERLARDTHRKVRDAVRAKLGSGLMSWRKSISTCVFPDIHEKGTCLQLLVRLG
jgi:hypothetical protein